MRVVFAGTPEFAQVALLRLIEAGHAVPLVLTQPDRPSGRGLKLHPSPVKATAVAHGVPVAQPRSLRLDGRFPEEAAAARQALLDAAPDLMVVAAYGLILPQWVLDLPRLGCLNIHASLLPRWRGAAPIHRAIEAGDTRTGITLMQMDAGLDTGDMLLARALEIAPGDSTGTLHDRLAPLGGQLLVEALAQMPDGARLPRTPQPAEGVTYAHKIDKAQAGVDWTDPADLIERRIRAFDPAPGASSVLDGHVLKLWRARRGVLAGGEPGTVLAVSDEGIVVACGGQGSVELTELQRPGGKRLPVKQFLQGHAVAVGHLFGAAQAA
jgi:methionyl-tRNA formyltransferase